ncbi:MAG: hypothetical protein JWQ09_5461 [Segetibacter sp.]|nr:hypothetical protein [Segetibacter sp.]
MPWKDTVQGSDTTGVALRTSVRPQKGAIDLLILKPLPSEKDVQSSTFDVQFSMKEKWLR